jgi:hypothetical protein
MRDWFVRLLCWLGLAKRAEPKRDRSGPDAVVAPEDIDPGTVVPPAPEPEPEEPAKTVTWSNRAAGYRVRLKDYLQSATRNNDPQEGMHSGRGTVIKIDARFATDHGVTSENSRIIVSDASGYNIALFDFYAIDHESRDLSYGCHKMPAGMPSPLYVRLYVNNKLHTILKREKWAYESVSVPDKVFAVPLGWL